MLPIITLSHRWQFSEPKQSFRRDTLTTLVRSDTAYYILRLSKRFFSIQAPDPFLEIVITRFNPIPEFIPPFDVAPFVIVNSFYVYDDLFRFLDTNVADPEVFNNG